MVIHRLVRGTHLGEVEPGVVRVVLSVGDSQGVDLQGREEAHRVKE